jgi:hypothetical protein
MTPAMQSAFQALVIRPAIFVQINFLTGPLYIWSGIGTVFWNSHFWSGVGSFGGISTVEEGASIEARGIVLSLSGIDSSLLAGALQNLVQQLPVIVYLGLFDEGSVLIPDPIVMWAGTTDQPLIEISGASATISLNCESALLEMNVLVDRRYTTDDAQIFAPGDQAFFWVTSIQERQIFWGQVPTSSANV